MKNRTPRPHRQGGFTLVEMSVVLVIAGLLFAAVTTGQELVDTAKAKKAVSDLVAIEHQIQLYEQSKGRFPGDCDADGVIDYDAGATDRTDENNAVRAALYAYTSELPVRPTDGAAALAQNNGCALTGGTDSDQVLADADANPAVEPADGSPSSVATSSSNANVWLNDLKLANMISSSTNNRAKAKMVHEDFLFVGNITDSANDSADGQYNAIVMHNVPQWMASRMAQAINGQDSSANRSRLRSLVRNSTAKDGTYEATWQDIDTTTDAMQDSVVTVAYFFDVIPESAP